jgi:hypothetical protein
MDLLQKAISAYVMVTALSGFIILVVFVGLATFGSSRKWR